MLKLDWKRHELQHPGVLQWGAVGRKSYSTVRLGAPAKLKYLHSKIGRRVDLVYLARVRYGTTYAVRRGHKVTYSTCRDRCFFSDAFFP